MKRISTLCALLPALIVGAAAIAADCTYTLSPGDDIQAAIDAANPGEVICLNPGTYTPAATISVNKSVTLQGPQADVDPRPSAGTTRTPGDTLAEAIIDGGGALATIFAITADDVVLNGLEVRNGTGDLISSPGGAGISGVTLQYNIIHEALGDEAIQIRDCADCAVEFNYVFDIEQDGINVCCGSTGGIIHDNEVHDSYSENAGIYVYGSTNMTIECNLVYNIHQNDGIKLGAEGGDDAFLRGGSILYNVVHDTEQDGISSYISDVVVEGNEVYNSTSENGPIYVAWAVEDVTVTNNIVRDNVLKTWKWGDPGGIMIGEDVSAATVHVNGNNIFNNSPNGLTNKALDSLDAEDNWWGAADGPSGEGPGSGDYVSTYVDFDPWLGEPVVIESPCGEPGVIEVPVDIKPRSCPNPLNVKAGGVLPVAILGTEDFDVSLIDPDSVLLEGVSPLRWNLQDVAAPFEPYTGKEDCFEDCTEAGPDGYTDLTLKFKKREIVAALGEVSDRECLVLTLTGSLIDGTLIMGEDVVLILKKGKKPKSARLPQAENVLNDSSFGPGDAFTASFKLNEAIERPLTAFAVVILPNGSMLNAVTLDTPLRTVVVNMPRLDPLTYPLLDTTVPPGAPMGDYELVVAFFEPGIPITGRADAFLEASNTFTIQ